MRDMKRLHCVICALYKCVRTMCAHTVYYKPLICNVGVVRVPVVTYYPVATVRSVYRYTYPLWRGVVQLVRITSAEHTIVIYKLHFFFFFNYFPSYNSILVIIIIMFTDYITVILSSAILRVTFCCCAKRFRVKKIYKNSWKVRHWSRYGRIFRPALTYKLSAYQTFYKFHLDVAEVTPTCE